MVRLRRGPDEGILRELVRRAAEDSGKLSGFNGTVLLRRRGIPAASPEIR
jgi:hypothetical protein